MSNKDTVPLKTETINAEPHWPGMFRFAIHLTEQGLSVGEGRGVVIEMLEFGQRLQKLYEEEHND